MSCPPKFDQLPQYVGLVSLFLIVFHDPAELFKMVCEANADVDIRIPAVMLPQYAGESLEKFITNNTRGMSFFIDFMLAFTVSSSERHLPSYQEICLIVFIFLCLVSVAFYSPKRPTVDIAEVFLWLMAVGTVFCASYWSAWTAREAAIEQDKLLKASFTCQVT